MLSEHTIAPDFTLPDAVPAPQPVRTQKAVKEAPHAPKSRSAKSRKGGGRPGFRPPKPGKGRKKR